MAENRTPHHLTLPDGRHLDYLITGAQDGHPFVFIHGTPGSFHTIASLERAAERKGLKLITLSRAGYGGSTRWRGRSVVDAVKDIEALLAHLGVKKCLVGGWSGGGPHALACAARLPACEAALSVAGCAPYDAEGLDWLAGQGQDNIEETEAALKGEAVLAPVCEAQRAGMLAGTVEGVIEGMASLLPEVDRVALRSNRDLGEHMVVTTNEALKNNVDGLVDDTLAFVRPWGFELSEIKVPVLLYQGSLDLMVPYSHGQWLAEHLPQKQLRKHLMEGQGHISIFVGESERMIDELLEISKK